MRLSCLRPRRPGALWNRQPRGRAQRVLALYVHLRALAVVPSTQALAVVLGVRYQSVRRDLILLRRFDLIPAAVSRPGGPCRFCGRGLRGDHKNESRCREAALTQARGASRRVGPGMETRLAASQRTLAALAKV